MMTLMNTLKADWLRLKHTPFFLIHLLVPFTILFISEGYMKLSAYTTEGFTGGYFQVIALGFPIIIATVTSTVSEQEIEAGSDMWLLSTPSRRTSLISKLIYLLIFSLISCELAACGFGLITPFIRDDFSMSFSKLITAGGLIWVTALFNYVLFFFISLKFTRTINFGMAIFSVLIGTLFLTGLGDTLWVITPSAWGARIVSLFFNSSIEGQLSSFDSPILITLIMIVSIIVAFTLLFLWFSTWEGRKSEE